MSDFPQMRLTQRVSQSMAQTQVQKMSQNQILSMHLLSLPSSDLRNEIYKKTEENPALEIVKDNFASGEFQPRVQNSHFSDDIRYGKASHAKQIASDNFQEALENNEDFRETLFEHLEHQLNSMNLSAGESALCRKLIANLDKKGFHILAPETLLDASNPKEDGVLLSRCIWIIQQLDPVGTCTKNYEESLLVQAEISGGASECTVFLLKHFDFLNPPQPQKIQKKIKNYLSRQKQLKFANSGASDFSEDFEHDLEDIEESLAFIRTLSPFPAQNFGTSQTNYVLPEVKVTKTEDGFDVELKKGILPKIEVSKSYEKLIDEVKIQDGDTSPKAEQLKAQIKFTRNNLNDARSFIESLEFRQNTLFAACREIVEIQKAFFEKGPGNIVPLRQKDIAEKLKVHETTISRMANSKFLECEWGIFPVSYFFSNSVGNSAAAKTESDSSEGVSEKTAAGKTEGLSKESVKFEIKRLLEEHADDKKAPSDQKISDWLAERGIKVARRTVAKYRSELNLASSYER